MYKRIDVPADTVVVEPLYNSGPATITVTPAPGATAFVQFTISPAEELAAGTEVWVPWGIGAVTDVAADVLLAQATFLQFGSIGGAVVAQVRV